MARKKSTGTAIVPSGTPERDVTHCLNGTGEPVLVEAIYRVPGVHPTKSGPWSDEADKIAWTDPMTGFGCIIRRSPRDGHLSGFVSVPAGHPLFGRRVNTLGDYLIGVHGGLDYSAACQHWESEELSVCHPSGNRANRIGTTRVRQNVHMNEVAEDAGEGEAWWLGFSCNQVDDVTPGRRVESRKDQLLDGVVDPTYKTEAFVYHECVRLAGQLKAIGEGRDPRDADPGPSNLDVLLDWRRG